jgi:hypothetical protein
VAWGVGAPPITVTVEAGKQVSDIDFRPATMWTVKGKMVAAGPGNVKSAGPGSGFWRVYDFTNGLPDDDVTSMLQDQQGNLWFGTGGGISRYDGDAFVNFTSENGLAGNRVTTGRPIRVG